MKQTRRLTKGTYGYLWGQERDSQGVWDQDVHFAVFKIDNQQWIYCIAKGTMLNILLWNIDFPNF